jgi:hypothetical protein
MAVIAMSSPGGMVMIVGASQHLRTAHARQPQAHFYAAACIIQGPQNQHLHDALWMAAFVCGHWLLILTSTKLFSNARPCWPILRTAFFA